MKWTKQIPTEVGWYWRRDTTGELGEPDVVYVRRYVDRLAIDNACIGEWASRYEWAGPIPMPDEATDGKISLVQALEAVEQEAELPGEMPDYLYRELILSKDHATEIIRNAVCATKSGIRNRLSKL